MRTPPPNTASLEVGHGDWMGTLQVRWAGRTWAWRLLNCIGVVLDHGERLMVPESNTPDEAMKVLVTFLLCAVAGELWDEFAPPAVRWATHNERGLRQALRDLRIG